jgi:7-cyano-7-deazaguanine synthase
MVASKPNPLAPVSEWWPYRNQLLVTLAAARGLSLGIRLMIVGAVATDGSHADGTAAFFATLDELMRLQEGNLVVEAPAIAMSTVELVRTSGVPREALAWAHSCHTGPLACGGCRGCIKHFRTMGELYGEAY